MNAPNYSSQPSTKTAGGALLREWLEREQQDQREAAVRALTLEALRDRVCPLVHAKDWRAILSGREPLDKWIHRVRMAHALGLERGKL